jgi:hypothetical protein
VVEEAVGEGLPGLVFTYGWALDDPGDTRSIAALVDIVERGGGTVHFVELASPLGVRRVRNATELRREHKRTHRDAELSEQILVDLERFVLNSSDGQTPEPAASVLEGRTVRIDNTDLPPEQVAVKVARHFDLPLHEADRA